MYMLAGALKTHRDDKSRSVIFKGHSLENVVNARV